MKYFAHLTNLVLVQTMANAYFTQTMDELRQAQRIFCMQLALDAIGLNCPQFMQTRWSFMTDILTNFVDDFVKCTSFLMDCAGSLAIVTPSARDFRMIQRVQKSCRQLMPRPLVVLFQSCIYHHSGCCAIQR
jgi:hypothetical protein